MSQIEGYKSQQFPISATDVSNSDNYTQKVNIPEEVESQGPRFGSPGLLRKLDLMSDIQIFENN